VGFVKKQRSIGHEKKKCEQGSNPARIVFGDSADSPDMAK